MIVQMLVEMSFILSSLLLLVYSIWRYLKIRKNKQSSYFILSFVFLTFSAIFQAFNSILPYGIYFNVTVLRLFELGALALFACFTISAVVALKNA